MSYEATPASITIRQGFADVLVRNVKELQALVAVLNTDHTQQDSTGYYGETLNATQELILAIQDQVETAQSANEDPEGFLAEAGREVTA